MKHVSIAIVGSIAFGCFWPMVPPHQILPARCTLYFSVPVVSRQSETVGRRVHTTPPPGRHSTSNARVHAANDRPIIAFDPAA